MSLPTQNLRSALHEATEIAKDAALAAGVVAYFGGFLLGIEVALTRLVP